MSVAGVFLIQGLEGSRIGRPTLWVLNSGAEEEGWRAEESIGHSPVIQSWWRDVSKFENDEASNAGARVAMRRVLAS